MNITKLTLFNYNSVVEQSEQAKEMKKSEASRGVDYFRDRLGLQFTKQKGIVVTTLCIHYNPLKCLRNILQSSR